MSGSVQPDFSREFLCSEKSEQDHPQGLPLSLPAVPIYRSLALRPATKAGSPTLLNHRPLQIAVAVARALGNDPCQCPARAWRSLGWSRTK